MKKIFYNLLFILILAWPVHAETRIDYSVIREDTVWNKENSPYILTEPLEINGATLKVMPGVKILGEQTDPNIATYIYVSRGVFDIEGTKEEPVEISDLPQGIGLNSSKLILERGQIHNIGELSIQNSVAVIATSSFKKFDDGLKIKNSNVKIWGSRIENMTNGILVEDKDSGIFQTKTILMPNIGGIGNALNDGEVVLPLEIAYSSLINTTIALSNNSSTTVEARNNWWGSSHGPNNPEGIGNEVRGLVSYEPWLTEEPQLDDDNKLAKCCSSVLFLPGLEASQLFLNEKSPVGGITFNNQLWEPNRNKDVQKLFLTATGSSTNPNIYSGSPLGKVFGVFGVYDNFMNFLDTEVNNGIFKEWKAFGYDWRKSIDEVVLGKERKATTTESLLGVVADLASRSATGKVTIIAHSNGGLVAKYLVGTLENMGKSNLIDKVISVAVPYLGTPQAVAGILHGDNQELAKGFILRQSTARDLGLNMSSAYSLLPSTVYFEKFLGPTIVFASDRVTGINNGTYPRTVNDVLSQNSFLTDKNNSRMTPVSSDVDSPAKGNAALVSAATLLHGIIDPLVWPAEVAKFAIVGWNKKTTKNIFYDKDGSHEASTTNMGDGTVVSQSAAYNDGRVGSVDLDKLSSTDAKNFVHANILEASAIQKMIELAIQNTETNWCSGISSLPAVSCGEPDYSKERGISEIRLSTHSPVELHVYDSSGRHTGVLAPTDLMIAEASADGEGLNDLITRYENNIIGSDIKVKQKENNDVETTVSLPDNGQKYNVEIKGVGVGTFTYDVERFKDGVMVGKVEYANIPVTPLTLATTTIEYTLAMAVSSSTAHFFASSTKPLWIDYDGDGASDTKIEPNTKLQQAHYIEALQRLLKKFGYREHRFNKIISLRNKFTRHFRHLKFKDLSEKDRSFLIDEIEERLAHVK